MSNFSSDCTSAESRCVSPSEFKFNAARRSCKIIEHRRHVSKNLGGLGAGPQVRWAFQNGIRKSFSESVLTKSKTVADPTRSVSQSKMHRSVWLTESAIERAISPFETTSEVFARFLVSLDGGTLLSACFRGLHG